MVLQQLPSPTVLWGFAKAGTPVKVSRSAGSAGTPGATATVTAGSDGVWRAEMAGRPAGNESFGFTATAVAGDTIALTDTVYGDVWVCSGQVRTIRLTRSSRC